MNMDKIIVTGGAGYVGSVLVSRLLQEGYSVQCLDSLRYGGESLVGIWGHPNFDFRKCDITDFDKVGTIIKTSRASAIVHLAAIVGDPACKSDPELATRTNWDASMNLLKMAMDNGISRFIFASTCSNYGKMADPESFVTEDSPLAPVSLYAELKVKFEDVLLNEIPKHDGFSPTSLRFSTVYGMSPRMRFDLTVNEFTKDLAMGKELVVFGEKFWRPYCHVTDFSRAILAVLRASREIVAYNVFNIGDTGENYTKEMIVNEIMKQIPDARVKYVQKNEDPRDYRVDFSKIKQSLGFTIGRTVPDGIKEIKELIQLKVIENPEDQRYYNIPHNA